MNVLAGLGENLSGGALAPVTLVAPGDAVAALVFPTSTNPVFVESTILRIRGSLSVPKSTNATIAGLSTMFAFGIAVMSEQAAQTLEAIPNPATATGYDWDGWMFLRGPNAQIPVDINGTIVDVKAQRIWKGGDAIVFVAGVASDNPTPDASSAFQFSLRGLFLLP